MTLVKGTFAGISFRDYTHAETKVKTRTNYYVFNSVSADKGLQTLQVKQVDGDKNQLTPGKEYMLPVAVTCYKDKIYYRTDGLAVEIQPSKN